MEGKQSSIRQVGRFQTSKAGHFKNICDAIDYFRREINFQVGQILLMQGVPKREKRKDARLPAGQVIGSKGKPLFQIGRTLKEVPGKRFGAKSADYCTRNLRIKADLDLIKQSLNRHCHSFREG